MKTKTKRIIAVVVAVLFSLTVIGGIIASILLPKNKAVTASADTASTVAEPEYPEKEDTAYDYISDTNWFFGMFEFVDYDNLSAPASAVTLNGRFIIYPTNFGAEPAIRTRLVVAQSRIWAEGGGGLTIISLNGAAGDYRFVLIDFVRSLVEPVDDFLEFIRVTKCAKVRLYNTFYNDINSTAYNYGYDYGYYYGVQEGGETSYDTGYNDGYEVGHEDGYTEGDNDGYIRGYDRGHEVGYNSGSDDGYASGYNVGSADGYSDGYSAGLNKGISDGVTNPISSFIKPVHDFMNTAFFGTLTYASIFNVVLFVAIAIIFIKMFSGG